MARTPSVPSGPPGEVDLTAGSDIADPMVPMGANPDDAVLRQIVESVAYGYERSDIREASSPRLEFDRLRAAARELLRRADVASRATRAARHEDELRLP
jgi:hypothetical protein